MFWKPKMCEGCKQNPATGQYGWGEPTHCASIDNPLFGYETCLYACGDECCGVNLSPDAYLITTLWELNKDSDGN